MKNLVLYPLTPLMTFALGVGIDRLIWQRPLETVPTVVVEQHREMLPTPAEPVQARVEPPLPPATQEPILILDYPSEAFGIHAGYFMMGSKPKEFADFQFLEVVLSDHDSNNFITLYENSELLEDYSAVFALVTERRLFFVTSKGISSDFEYRFEGEFVQTDFDKVAGKNIVALRGTLTKTKDGRKIAEHVVSFRMDYLGC